MPSPRLLLRKARSFLRLPAFEMLWFVPVWTLLGLSRAAILAVHFRRLAPWLGLNAGVLVWIPLLTPLQERRARLIRNCVRRAAGYTPWESNCFPQAVTARILMGLYRLPYGLYLGVCRDETGQGMKAHAWVAAGRIQVSGGASFRQFTVVGCFLSPSLAEVVSAQPLGQLGGQGLP